MALVNMDFYSYYLGMDTPLTVLLPERRGRKPEPMPDKKYPVLYLLHGHGDDHTAWIRKSNVELLTRDHEMIVVMPAAHRGFYVDGKSTYRYFSFLTEELPVVVGNLFPASQRREDTYICGLSMGGYGALELAMHCPETYGHAASMSGALEPYKALRSVNDLFSAPDFLENLERIFGGEEETSGSRWDLRFLARELEKRNDVPPPQMYVCCGTEDPLYPIHKKMRGFLEQETRLDIRFDERPGGHTWDFWNEELALILTYFGLVP
ncbi:MAG: esterase family protein [Lachnospiraceae bacterium]|nr:esterase family protein [Lachnospiraceae bacterium]